MFTNKNTPRGQFKTRYITIFKGMIFLFHAHFVFFFSLNSSCLSSLSNFNILFETLTLLSSLQSSTNYPYCFSQFRQLWRWHIQKLFFPITILDIYIIGACFWNGNDDDISLYIWCCIESFIHFMSVLFFSFSMN